MLVILEAIAGQSEPTLARHERARSLARCQNQFGRSGAAISSGSRELAMPITGACKFWYFLLTWVHYIVGMSESEI